MSETNGNGSKRRIFVTVGTDHHRFDRLIDWVDRWLEDGGSERADVLVQSGSSRRPRAAESRQFLPAEEMGSSMEGADVVVCHAGPGSITEARSRGRMPIVVARRKRLGEIVDEHQRAFAHRMDRLGRVRAAENERTFRSLLDSAVSDPAAFRLEASASDVSGAAGKLEDLVHRLAEPVVQPRPGEGRIRVLFIGGVGRSGTTLLDRMLGGLPGTFSVGELVHIWIRGLEENVLCGCGQPFSECPFWSEVGQRAYGGWDRLDPEDITRQEMAVRRHRFVPYMMMPGIFPAYDRDFREFARLLPPLYRAIRDISGAQVIVDSSKDASQVFLLRRLPNIDLRVVQMVRESHGVAYSWSKRVRRPEVQEREVYMQTYHPARVGARWMTYNLMFDLLKGMGIPTTLLRYEDLVRDADRELRRIARFAGTEVGDGALDFIQDGGVQLPETHSVSGNPMRFKKGPAPLRVDEEWRTKMAPKDRTIVTATTWPLLARYGYLGRSRRG
jgi:UDP-N-acetylglucosamine transferase subunit ALG13